MDARCRCPVSFGKVARPPGHAAGRRGRPRTLARARAASLLIAVVAAGCMPVGPAGEAAPEMEMPGPVLVAEVVNRSDRDVVFEYRYEADVGSSEGSGEGLLLACSATTESWAEITGNYALMLDGAVLVEDHLAAGQGDGAYLVVRIQVAPDGDVVAMPPVLLAVAPPLGSRELADC